MLPREKTVIVNRQRYSTDGATLLAGDDYWDGHNHERRGRNTFLYKTAKGKYFAVHQTQWQGELDKVETLEVDDAAAMYEALSEKRVEFEEAFPGVEIEEA